jgi:hypothetical protein
MITNIQTPAFLHNFNCCVLFGRRAQSLNRAASPLEHSTSRYRRPAGQIVEIPVDVPNSTIRVALQARAIA